MVQDAAREDAPPGDRHDEQASDLNRRLVDGAECPPRGGLSAQLGRGDAVGRVVAAGEQPVRVSCSDLCVKHAEEPGGIRVVYWDTVDAHGLGRAGPVG